MRGSQQYGSGNQQQVQQQPQQQQSYNSNAVADLTGGYNQVDQGNQGVPGTGAGSGAVPYGGYGYFDPNVGAGMPDYWAYNGTAGANTPAPAPDTGWLEDWANQQDWGGTEDRGKSQDMQAPNGVDLRSHPTLKSAIASHQNPTGRLGLTQLSLDKINALYSPNNMGLRSSPNLQNNQVPQGPMIPRRGYGAMSVRGGTKRGQQMGWQGLGQPRQQQMAGSFPM
jgi:hypothetical protein